MKKALSKTLVVFLAVTMLLCGCLPDVAIESSEDLTSDFVSSVEELTSSVINVVEESSSLEEISSEEIISVEEVSSEEESSVEEVSSEETSSEVVSSHTHTFSKATCTTPKTCSCGETEGKALGHTWKDATCTTPKTCTICGNTTGLLAGHKFSNGKCTICGKADPNNTGVTMVWIPSSGKKYHSNSSCSGMKNPSQVSKSKAESLGYTPCKKCY